MKGFDRSKFKATKVAEAVKQDEELASSLGNQRNGFTSYIRLKEGKNMIRIYPPHPEEMGGGDTFAEPKVTLFLPMMVPDRDTNGQPLTDKTGRPILKESVKSVYNSRIHGGTEKDLVEEYIAFAIDKFEKELKEADSPNEKAAIEARLEKIKGNYKKKVQGLNYRQAWALYVDEIIIATGKTNFGTLEVGKAIKERLNALSMAADDGEDVIATDPFTDPDTGRAVQIEYNKNATKPQDYYKTELDQKTTTEAINGRNYTVNRTFPLSDDQLAAFMEVEPLAKRFKNCFTRKDYNLQLEGLEFFDKKNGLGIFNDPEWIEIVEEIDGYYPEIDDENNEDTALDRSEKKVNKATKTTATRGRLSEREVLEQSEEVEEEEQSEEEEGDQFDLMSRLELSSWHKKNATGLVVKPSITTDELRELAREFLADSQVEEEDDSYTTEEDTFEEGNFEEEVEEEDEEPAPVKTTSRLDKLRNRNK